MIFPPIAKKLSAAKNETRKTPRFGRNDVLRQTTVCVFSGAEFIMGICLKRLISYVISGQYRFHPQGLQCRVRKPDRPEIDARFNNLKKQLEALTSPLKELKEDSMRTAVVLEVLIKHLAIADPGFTANFKSTLLTAKSTPASVADASAFIIATLALT